MKSANELNSDYELRRRVSASWTPEQASPACSKQERGQIKKNVWDMRKLVIITVQVGLLAVINFVGHLIAAHLFFSRLPGNLVGMLLLFAMLSSRVIPLAWVQEAASVLTRHFAFFFIPLAVGLIAFKGVFLQHGLPILGTLIFSAACGMFLCGSVAQLTDKQGAKKHEIATARIRHWYHRIGIRR